VVLVVVIAVVTTLMVMRARKAAAANAGIKTAQAQMGSLVQSISATGSIAAETGADVHIGSQITGTIKHLYTDLGKQVTAGQVIAELDAPDLKANLDSAQQALAQAQTKYQQQLSTVGMLNTQVQGAFEQAEEAVHKANAERDQAAAGVTAAQSQVGAAQASLVGAQARLKSAQAAYRSAQAGALLQPAKTTADIANAQAGLSTAQAALAQTQKGAALQIHNAQAALSQAQSNLALADANLVRQKTLLAKGYVAQQDLDTAQNQDDDARQAVVSAQNTLNLTSQAQDANLQTAQDQVAQAQATLAAAQAETYSNTVSTEAVNSAQGAEADAQSAVVQAQSSLDAARDNVKTAQAQVQSANSDIRNAADAQRIALGNLTQNKLQQQNVADAYEAQRQAQAQVAYQAAQYDKAYIRSPISGTVITLAQQEGETVAAGLSAPTLVEVVDLTRLEAHGFVDETDIAKVRVGMPATVAVDAFPKRTFTGTVTKIDSAATIQDNVITYQVTVGLDYPKVLLKPQMTCEVTCIVSQQDNVLLVPNEAIKQPNAANAAAPGATGALSGAGQSRPAGATGGAAQGGPSTGSATALSGAGQAHPGGAKGGKPPVINEVVTYEDSKAEVHDVTIGATDGTNTAILSGLKSGDTVVLAGFDQLGLQQFTSGAKLPGFLTRGPLGTGSGGH
jgi:HlyD family secretion protein